MPLIGIRNDCLYCASMMPVDPILAVDLKPLLVIAHQQHVVYVSATCHRSLTTLAGVDVRHEREHALQ